MSDDSERGPPSLDLAALAMRSGDEAWPDVCFSNGKKPGSNMKRWNRKLEGSKIEGGNFFVEKECKHGN